ncbi:MAG TPA: kelch repeat-containing protein, partial [Dehalococcoidia bacterium]|nr:kelch repeat-containing protein [Dehalococcoidia bacterium]
MAESPQPTATATATAPENVSVFDATPTWTQLGASGPSPRRDHSLVATADGSRAYVFGGRDGNGPLADFWLLDVAGGTWTQVEGGPPARFGHNTVFDVGSRRIVVFGGQGVDGFFNDTWSFDGSAWQQLNLASAPSPRYGAGAAYDAASAGVYVSHGFTDNGRFDDTWRLPLEGDAWGDESPSSGPRPVRRCLLRTVLDPRSGRIILYGGQTDDDPFLGDLWAFDPSTDTWTDLAAQGPAARNLYSLVVADQPAAVLFGGRTEAGAANDLWILDFLSDSWLQLTAAGESPPARSGHDAAWLAGGNGLLIFGGRDGDQSLLNDLWQL